MPHRPTYEFEYETENHGKRNCTCDTQRTPLAPALRGYRTRLGCYCESEPILGRCQCSEQPWGKGMLSDFVGMDCLTHPQELNDPSNRNLYKVGCYLHCLVRKVANTAISREGLDIGIAEVEARTFSRPLLEPLDLCKITIRDISHLFIRRAMFDFMTLRGRLVYDLVQQRKYENEQMLELYRNPAQPMKSVIVSTGLGDFLDTVQKMGSYAWVDIWKTINMLEISGLSESRGQSYDLVFNAEWPDVTRERDAAKDLARIELLEARVSEADHQLENPLLSQEDVKKLSRKSREAFFELCRLKSILWKNETIADLEEVISRPTTSPKRRAKALEQQANCRKTVQEIRLRLLRDDLKTSLSRGNKWLRAKLPDSSSLYQADAVAQSCQRDGILINLEHFFSSDSDREAFIRNYVSETAEERARKLSARAVGKHADRLQLEIFDDVELDDDLPEAE